MDISKITRVRGMKKRAVYMYLAMCLALALSVTGCSKKTVSSDGVRTVEKDYTRNRYQNIYTSQLWSVKADDSGATFEEKLLGQIEQFLIELGTTNLMADEQGIELTGQEKDSLKALAKEYYRGLSEQDRDYMGVTESEVYDLYCESYRADKLVAELTRDENLEVSDAVAKVIQNREAVHPGTYIGKGKIEEVAALIQAYDANGVICDDELSPAQLNNLERELDCKVMDRTLLILDIFAARAVSSEGKIQVELAQLRYRAARLVGLRESLSRLGGGIGTRGPGEKKLETDRRLIRTRISALKAELFQVEKHRELIRGKRSRGNLKTAAIVGYTNAGKSTLLNTLTGAGILAEDKLFATLDPTTRVLELKDGQQILLTDTVGFIRKLPHHLVDLYKLI